MAQAVLFDTLYYAKKFEEAGCSQRHAEAQVLLMTELINNMVCTKQDLFHTELESKSALKGSQNYLEIKLKETETKLQWHIKETESRLELKIKEIEIRLAKVEAEIVEIKKDIMDLKKSVLEIQKALVTNNASTHMHIAKWILGTSALQISILLTFMKLFIIH